MSASHPDHLPRHRGKFPGPHDPVTWFAGRRITPPPGVIPHPGPTILTKYKRKTMLRVDWHDSQFPGLAAWFATAEGRTPRNRLVATGEQLEDLLLYLNDRFSPCVIDVVIDGKRIDPNGPIEESPDMGDESCQ